MPEARPHLERFCLSALTMFTYAEAIAPYGPTISTASNDTSHAADETSDLWSPRMFCGVHAATSSQRPSGV